MKLAINCISFLSILAIVKSTTTCTASSDCTNLVPSSFSYCNPQNICQCQDMFILNCTNAVIPLFTGSTTLSLLPLAIQYYIISNYTDQSIEYILTLTDKTQIDMIMNYTIYLYIDNGFGTSPDMPTATVLDNGSLLRIDTQIKLGTMPGTNIAQNLILAIQNKQVITATILLDFNFATFGHSQTLMIVAYAGGAICLSVTIILMIMVYRKRRSETNPNHRQNIEPTINDISHFNVLMPLCNISIQHKKDGRVCSVCLQEFEITSIIRLTVCNHIFHSNCIDEWCIKNLICPMCRTDLSSNNILLLKMKNNKQENNSSWIVNSMDQEVQSAIQQDQEADRPIVYPPPNPDRIDEPLLSALNQASNLNNQQGNDDPIVQTENSNRASLIGNEQL